MKRQSKYPVEVKLEAIQKVLSHESTISKTAAEYGCHDSTLQEWINNYEAMGIDGIAVQNKNTPISAETKNMAVRDYLDGKGSISAICKKYQIRSTTTLRQWLRLYNENKELRSSGTGNSHDLNLGRKTTLDERNRIVQDCINKRFNYAEAARKYKVSYQQVYNWVKKYKANGIDGLKDGRGRRKS